MIIIIIIIINDSETWSFYLLNEIHYVIKVWSTSQFWNIWLSLCYIITIIWHLLVLYASWDLMSTQLDFLYLFCIFVG